MPRFLSVAQADTTSPRPIHGVLTAAAKKRLVVTALPGIHPDGTLPEGLEGQAEQAFANLAALLATAGLKRDDLVAVAAYVAAPGVKALIQRIGTFKLGAFRPSTAVRQVVSLSQAGCLIELDAEAISED